MRILLADDDQSLRRVIQFKLEQKTGPTGLDSKTVFTAQGLLEMEDHGSEVLASLVYFPST
ncbi:MAG: hypothetical protein IH939_14855, partial [Acidobacteria bacterium]|nr:hypothetical protein [Acidobacteriota bacterium]